MIEILTDELGQLLANNVASLRCGADKVDQGELSPN
jgi:hypothetical protein